jgi:beta-lactam-binding protein with PASTA domain/tRNA A-37 threonylcarbamoyl transferase component Bud32
MIGRVLDGRYSVESRIARGGMATVYVAHDNRLERKVAVKVMHGHLADDDAFKRRFIQEARSAARLSHPNVVNVFDQGQDAHMAYLVMEYLPGITLRDLLKQQQRLTAEQAYEVSEAILAGLAAAHAAGIMHRDLKPENVLLADDGRIKIGDFGLARAASANTTTGQALLGTIAYLSPELVTRGEADARSDVYAFGIMLFEMLTGKQPFTGDQPMQIAYKHANEDVPAPSTVTNESTPELDDLVIWTTTRDPEQRPKDATVVLTRLRELRVGGATAASLAVTQVLSSDGTFVTPSTTVLAEADSALLREQGAQAPKQTTEKSKPRTHIATAQLAAAQRSRSGRVISVVVAVLAVTLGLVGWWFGQGPGSLAVIPNVAGQKTSAAVRTLESLGLTTKVTQCSSTTVAVGLVVETKPRAGTQVEPGANVSVCESTGPKILPVPQVVGLSQSDAEKAITDAGFVFGVVSEKRFAADAAGTVLGATDKDGAALPDTLPEKTVINLLVSAGPLPDVSGASVSGAKSALTGAGLTVDDAMQASAFSDEIAEGRVISVVAPSEVVRMGDKVGLNISKGPQLFAVPNVVGKTVRQAVSELSAAGFNPVVDAEEKYWNGLTVTGTSPAAGTMIRKGESVNLSYPQ